ncbi:gluconolaconase [Mycobacteroides immunogenum]|uniref:Gluconolaconase n=1 Tax=Mycobacteroides immunogenum TaxID=83262 RepID=A0A179V6Z9_9MYCO|nr:gluconolaconase [Mycobacteroides immunogenum]
MVAAIAVVPASCAKTAETATPPRIDFSAPELYPETARWSPKAHTFFVGSTRHGTVGQVSTNGIYSPFIDDPDLVTVEGVLPDDAHNKLWVTNSDGGSGSLRSTPGTDSKLAGVAIYDETTGAKRAYYDLGSLEPGRHLVNDIAVDDDGNAYIVDSYTPTIYRIGTNGRASVFVHSNVFGTVDNSYNLDGIAWNTRGYLIVGNVTTGSLFRVSTSNPSEIARISLPEPLPGADGIHFVDDQHLEIAQQHLLFPGHTQDDRVLELESSDGWRTARISRQARSVESSPTSVTDINGNVYVLNSRLDTLMDPYSAKIDTFTLQLFAGQ